MKNVLIAMFCFCVTALQAQGRDGFYVKRDLAQYGGADYSNAVRVERGITLDKAFYIAESDPEIDYFVYLKGWQMVLPLSTDRPFDIEKDDPLHLVTHTPFRYDNGSVSEGYCRIFRHGDVVFFKKDGEWLGTAPGYADTYYKNSAI